MQKTTHVKHYLLLLGIGLTWGSQFLFNHIAIATVPPYVIAAGRSLIAGICLWLFLLIKRQPKETHYYSRSVQLKLILIAFLEAVLPFYLIAWGQQYISSSITALLIGTIPIFTAILLKLFLSHEKLTLGLILSILLGFIGLFVLLWPALRQSDITHLLAEGAVLTGALSFACALVLIKTLPPINPLVMTRNIFLIGSIPLLINLVVFHSQSVHAMSLASALAVFALGAICSACAYSMFVYLIRSAGAAFASLSNYLVPIFGAALGVLLLGDKITVYMLAALIIILLALLIAKIPGFNK